MDRQIPGGYHGLGISMATFHVEAGARTFVATIAATVFFRFSEVFGERVLIFRLNWLPTIERCHRLYGLRYNHIQHWRRDLSQEAVDNENPIREIENA